MQLRALPLDPNSALHALTAWDLGHGGSPVRLASLGWPEGTPTRVLAWPLVLLATPLGLVLPALPAFNLAVSAWIALGVVATAALGRSWGWPWPRALLTAVAATACAPHVFQLGEGRYENLVLLPLALAAWGATRGSSAGTAAVALGMAGVALSTPYQAVPGGLLVLALAAATGRRALLHGLAGLALAGAVAVPYFLGADGGESAMLGPAAASHVEPAALAELLLPRAHPPEPMPPPRSALARLALLGALPQPTLPGPGMPFHGPAAASYLGWTLLLSGLAGLWRARAERRTRALALAGALVLLLSLGARLHLVAGQATALPLPWSLSLWLPGLADMQVSLRFLTGVGVVLAVGAGALAGRSWGRAALLGGLILVESLLVAPTRWPIEGVLLTAPGPAQALPDGPVAVFPGTPSLSGHQLAVLQLTLDRPLATFDASTEQRPGGEAEAGGFQATAPATDRHGRSAVEWLAHVQAAGATTVLTPGWLPRSLWPPVGSPPTCAEDLCAWELTTSRRAPRDSLGR